LDYRHKHRNPKYQHQQIQDEFLKIEIGRN